MTSTMNHSRITADQLVFSTEKSKSKSGQERTKIICKNSKTDWTITAEGATMNVLFEDMGEDGNLGKFGITDPRSAAYSMTLIQGVAPEHLTSCTDEVTKAHIKKTFADQNQFFDFVRNLADTGVEFMLEQGLLKKPVEQARNMAKKLFKGDKEKIKSYVRESVLSGATIPIGTDDRTGNATFKLKARLCKWAPEGEEPQRNEVRVFSYDGIKFKQTKTKISRNDWVRPTVAFSFWATPAAYGMSAEIKSVLMVRQGPGVRTNMPSMTIPDLPPAPVREDTEDTAEPALKRAKTEM